MRLDMPNVPLNWRNLVAFGHDVLAAMAAWMLAYALRFNFEIPEEYVAVMLNNLPWIVGLQSSLFFITGMYRGLWRYASLADLRRILMATGIGALAISATIALLRLDDVPRSVLILYFVLLTVLMGASRVLYRAWKEGHLSRVDNGTAKRVIVLGAGDAAASLLKSVARTGTWHFIGVLDDDPAKQGRQLAGVTVLGPLSAMKRTVQRTGAELAIIAMPEKSNKDRRRALEFCREATIQALTVPSYQDLVSGKVTVSQLRPVELDDLLGRNPVHMDFEGMQRWLSGRSVMVTGAGGSIGSELCRQLLHFPPAQLILVEQNELALYAMEQEFSALRIDTNLHYVIADVKDAQRLNEVFKRFKPSIVFHAAAYKHVPLMEDENAWEAVRNNALGTWYTAQAAMRYGSEEFILISTDKAVNPTNVMGASKRLAELLCQPLSTSKTRFIAVRFGNVLGSTGSVIPKFHRQIAEGGPVTVTHPEIRRFFMSIPEATELVLQAGLMGKGGEIFVLDMGEAVKIADLARDLIRLSGFNEDDIKIEYTGLRPGEKLYEELLTADELTLATPHPKLRVMRAGTIPNADWISQTVTWMESETPASPTLVRKGLSQRIPEYIPADMSQPIQTISLASIRH
jgi:FlaA1/EpsC-like NDP-sugar epimerase